MMYVYIFYQMRGVAVALHQVGHQGILRLIYAYLKGVPREQVCTCTTMISMWEREWPAPTDTLQLTRSN
jgi:hypothetical protein